LDLINVVIDLLHFSIWQTAAGIIGEVAIAGQDDGEA